jgi:hypothetical protein
LKEAVVPSSAAGPVNINPPLNEREKVGAFSNQREPIAESWGQLRSRKDASEHVISCPGLLLVARAGLTVNTIMNC